MGVNKAYCAIHQKDIHAVDNWDLILQQRSKTKPKKKRSRNGCLHYNVHNSTKNIKTFVFGCII